MGSDRKYTALVTGASGFIGQVLVKHLVRKGVRVIAVMRDPAKVCFDPAVELYQQPDIGRSSHWDPDILGQVDVLYHLAGRAHVINETAGSPLELFRDVNLYGTVNLAESAVLAGVKRFVFVSSIGVIGNNSGNAPYTELSVPHPHDDYAVSKYEAEDALNDMHQSSSMEIVIVRPPLVYGPGNPGNFERLIRLVNSGLPMPFGSVTSKRSFIFVENLVDALSLCGTHPSASGHVWLVSDGDDKTLKELLRAVSERLDKPLRLVPFPVALMKLLARSSGKSKDVERLLSSLLVDSSNISSTLGWSPQYSLAEGLDLTIDWYSSTRS